MAHFGVLLKLPSHWAVQVFTGKLCPSVGPKRTFIDILNHQNEHCRTRTQESAAERGLRASLSMWEQLQQINPCFQRPLFHESELGLGMSLSPPWWGLAPSNRCQRLCSPRREQVLNQGGGDSSVFR